MTDEGETWRDRLGSVPADYYYRQDVLAAEIEHVFKPSWLCVGYMQDLQNHQDFITAPVRPGLLGTLEGRVAHFQQAYAQSMPIQER